MCVWECFCVCEGKRKQKDYLSLLFAEGIVIVTEGRMGGYDVWEWVARPGGHRCCNLSVDRLLQLLYLSPDCHGWWLQCESKRTMGKKYIFCHHEKNEAATAALLRLPPKVDKTDGRGRSHQRLSRQRPEINQSKELNSWNDNWGHFGHLDNHTTNDVAINHNRAEGDSQGNGLEVQLSSSMSLGHVSGPVVVWMHYSTLRFSNAIMQFLYGCPWAWLFGLIDLTQGGLNGELTVL